MKALELAEKLEQQFPIGTAQHYLDGEAAAELRRLATVEADCAPYLKEGETPAERIKRALGDADSLMSLYRDVVAERDALKAENALLEEMNTQLREQNDAVGKACAKYEAELERIKALPPVAWRSSMGHGVTLKESITDDQKALTWDGKPMWQPLIALGSKTDE